MCLMYSCVAPGWRDLDASVCPPICRKKHTARVPNHGRVRCSHGIISALNAVALPPVPKQTTAPTTSAPGRLHAPALPSTDNLGHLAQRKRDFVRV